MDGHAAAVLLRHRAQALQVVAAVGALRGQTVRPQRHRLGAVVLEAEHHESVLNIDRRSDEPFFGVRLRGAALDGVVQRGAHDGADLPRGQKPQRPAVGHAGHPDVLFLTVHAFGRQ